MKTQIARLFGLGIIFLEATSSIGQNWTLTSAPSNAWSSVACSPDGVRIVATAYNGGVYVSTDSGNHWSPTSAPTNGWGNVCCSTNFVNIAAISFSGLIWISTNSGDSWVSAQAPSTNWDSIACSGDGEKLVASTRTGGIWASMDAGMTWSLTTAPTANPDDFTWNSVTSSADGTKLAALASGRIYTSADSGATWGLTSAPPWNWSTIASSSDGMKLAADFCCAGYVYTSSDAGGTWAEQPASIADWGLIVSSGDGTQLAGLGCPIVECPTHTILFSGDSGVDWVTIDDSDNPWNCLVLAANGDLVIAAVSGGGIYVWQPITPIITTQPQNQTVPSGTNIMLNVSVASTTLVTYQWQFDGTNIPGATNAKLLLTNITSLNAGSYAVEVANTFSNASSGTAIVSVMPVVITSQPGPAAQTVLGGATVSYGVGISTVASVLYQWQKDGTNLLGATNATLELANVNIYESGTYDVLVTNSAGAVVSAGVILTVVPAVVSTGAADPSLSSAVLYGSFTAGSSNTVAFFEWGESTNYGNLTANVNLQNVAEFTISNLILGLEPYTTYHCQAVASNVFGAVLGGDIVFTTVPRFVQVGTNSDWSSFALSAAGGELVAARGGNIYVSTNLGLEFELTSGTGNVCAVSSNGATIIAVSVSNIYASMDHGLTWTTNVAPAAFSVFASSSSAQDLAASDTSATVYTSTNFGATWQGNAVPDSPASGLASSADGTHLYGTGISGEDDDESDIVYPSWAYASTNSGKSWYPLALDFLNSHAVACSADGSIVVLAAYFTMISTNDGNSWISVEPPFYDYSVASSANASTLVSSAGGGVYVSVDTGNTWYTPNAPRGTVSVSADGKILAVFNGSIYLAKLPPTQPFELSATISAPDTVPTFTVAGVPGYNYYVEASSDLINWTYIATLVNTNGTVLFTDSSSSNYSQRFYRLTVAP